MPWMEILMLAIGVALVTMICGGTFPPSGAGSALRCPRIPPQVGPGASSPKMAKKRQRPFACPLKLGDGNLKNRRVPESCSRPPLGHSLPSGSPLGRCEAAQFGGLVITTIRRRAASRFPRRPIR